MGCFCSKHDNQSEDPINEPRPQLTEPRYDNAGQIGGGSHSPPTPAPNEPAPHEIGVAVTTPDNTATQQQQELYGTSYPSGTSSAPQAPATIPESAAEGDNRQGNARSRSSSSSSSSSNRETRRAEGGNRG